MRQPSKKPSSADPLVIANATGFPLQMAIEEAVRQTSQQHGWQVTSTEHSWRDGDSDRFVDLILTRGAIHMVIECKRHRAARWVFLVSDPPHGRRAEIRRWFRTPYLRNEDSSDGRRALTSLSNFQVEPRAWESSFCAVGGASDRDERSMLDRICAELTRGSEGVLAQQLAIPGASNQYGQRELRDDNPWIAIPVVVTTAELHVCRFDPASVRLDLGEIPAAGAVEQVEAIRYRKNFDVGPPPTATSLSDLHKHGQRSVAIVTASHLANWLGQFTIERASYGDDFP